MGCLRTIGCLVVALMIAAVAYLTRDLWSSHLHLHRHERVVDGRAAATEWEPLTATGAERAKQRVAALGARGGPGYVSVSGGDFASYVVRVGGNESKLPVSIDSASAAVIGRELHLRTTVDLRALAGDKTLGPMARLLGDRAPVELAGTVDTPQSNGGSEAAFQITGLTVNGVSLPSAVIPRVLDAIRRGSGTTVLVRLPAPVGGINVGGGQITLYKRVP
jgi:hypothetical protein